jgi:hypothetical protein
MSNNKSTVLTLVPWAVQQQKEMFLLLACLPNQPTLLLFMTFLNK